MQNEAMWRCPTELWELVETSVSQFYDLLDKKILDKKMKSTGRASISELMSDETFNFSASK